MTPADVEARRATIQRLFAAISAGDFASAVSLFSDDEPTYSFPRALGHDPCRGKAAIHALYERMAARFERPLQFVVRHIVVEGNLAVIEWDHSATTRAGNAYANSGVHVIEFAADGRIQHIRGYLDSAPMTTLNLMERGS